MIMEFMFLFSFKRAVSLDNTLEKFPKSSPQTGVETKAKYNSALNFLIKIH